MEKKHITNGTITIDIKEYRELVEEATKADERLSEIYRLTEMVAKTRRESEASNERLGSTLVKAVEIITSFATGDDNGEEENA